MIDISEGERRQAFAVWLRTGRLPHVRADGVELKFNPYHDPRDGRFTFAPGGPRSLARVVISHRRRPFPNSEPGVAAAITSDAVAHDGDSTATTGAIYRPERSSPVLIPANFRPPPRTGRGSNSRAFEDPMTLEQAFPGLRDAPAGMILSLADNIFDLTGPRNRMTAELTLALSNRLIEQIQAIDPAYRFTSLGFPSTIEGQTNQINELRFARAAAFARVRGEYRPLQVEIVRFIQSRADKAYRDGEALWRNGRLPLRLSREEAIGTYVDRRVLQQVRDKLYQSGFDPKSKGIIRVDQREYDTSKTDATFRRPDVRIDNVAFDVTLTRKTLATKQVKGFFNADFRPSQVVIVRPSQVDTNGTYIINRPETER